MDAAVEATSENLAGYPGYLDSIGFHGLDTANSLIGSDSLGCLNELAPSPSAAAGFVDRQAKLGWNC